MQDISPPIIEHVIVMEDDGVEIVEALMLHFSLRKLRVAHPIEFRPVAGIEGLAVATVSLSKVDALPIIPGIMDAGMILVEEPVHQLSIEGVPIIIPERPLLPEESIVYLEEDVSFSGVVPIGNPSDVAENSRSLCKLAFAIMRARPDPASYLKNKPFLREGFFVFLKTSDTVDV